MKFRVVGAIVDREVIAAGPGVKVKSLLNKKYGKARWRKMKGNAWVSFPNGKTAQVELHWYEAHGLGKHDMKIKRYWED